MRVRLAVVLLVVLDATEGSGRLPRSLQGLLGAAELGAKLRELVWELEEGRHNETLRTVPSSSFDNFCEGSQMLSYVPPFICFEQWPVIVVQYLPVYSMSWVLDHTDPSTLLGIALLASVENDTIPPRIGEFENLLLFHVASVAAPLPEEIAQLVHLRVFDILAVTGGPISMPRLDCMPNLQGLCLQNVEGGITGDWPTFENHTLLSSVDFCRAGITARPPDRLFQIETLLSLNLQHNHVFHNGPLPSVIAPGIVRLFLGNTSATGDLPAIYSRLFQAKRLELEGNRLTGTIPWEIGEMGSLVSLFLHDNNFTGTIPEPLGGLTSLQNLNLANNKLRGTLPSEIGQLSDLRELRFDGNAIHGTLPQELRNLTALADLSFESNRMTGHVFCLSSLRSVSCGDNYLDGSAPDECAGVWTQQCALSGLSDRDCEQRESECRLTDEKYALGSLCVPWTVADVVVALAVVFVVLGVMLWSFGRAKDAPRKLALAWSVTFAGIASLDAASSVTTLLVAYHDMAEGVIVCVVLGFAMLLHGVVGSILCPASQHLRIHTLLVIVLSRQMLVEMPWRAVLAIVQLPGDSRDPELGNSSNVPEQGSEIFPSPAQVRDSKRDLLVFTKNAALFQVVVNLAMLACQVEMFLRCQFPHRAQYAMCLGGACLLVSIALAIVHWRNMAAYSTTSRSRVHGE